MKLNRYFIIAGSCALLVLSPLPARAEWNQQQQNQQGTFWKGPWNTVAKNFNDGIQAVRGWFNPNSNGNNDSNNFSNQLRTGNESQFNENNNNRQCPYNQSFQNNSSSTIEDENISKQRRQIITPNSSSKGIGKTTETSDGGKTSASREVTIKVVVDQSFIDKYGNSWKDKIKEALNQVDKNWIEQSGFGITFNIDETPNKLNLEDNTRDVLKQEYSEDKADYILGFTGQDSNSRYSGYSDVNGRAGVVQSLDPMLIQHELGHILGLEHNNAQGTLMYPTVTGTELLEHESNTVEQRVNEDSQDKEEVSEKVSEEFNKTNKIE